MLIFQTEDMSQAAGLCVFDVITFSSSSTSGQLFNPHGKTHMQHYIKGVMGPLWAIPKDRLDTRGRRERRERKK